MRCLPVLAFALSALLALPVQAEDTYVGTETCLACHQDLVDHRPGGECAE